MKSNSRMSNDAFPRRGGRRRILLLLTLGLMAGLQLLAAASKAAAISAGNAPPLPLTGARIVKVATEPELQTAMSNLLSGDTILLADGTYHLTRSLYVNGRHNVTIRGHAGSVNVVLAGRGMDNPNGGEARFGVWSNGTNTTIAHLTIRDTYDNPIIFNPGAQSPRLYCLKLLDAGSQFIKVNPIDVAKGLGVNNGLVEYCWLEYTAGPPADHGAGIGYFNGISAHAARNWIIRGNLFKNLHNPDSAAYHWNAAVLMWRHSANTLTEQNTFVNVDRAIAYGLENLAYSDHDGGVIRNNFVYLTPGLMSASRTASSGAARNNLADAPIHLRDSATATQGGNLLTATPGLFVKASAADLHLLASATAAIDQARVLAAVTNDIDGDLRPHGAGPDIGADEFVGGPADPARSLEKANPPEKVKNR